LTGSAGSTDRCDDESGGQTNGWNDGCWLRCCGDDDGLTRVLCSYYIA